MEKQDVPYLTAPTHQLHHLTTPPLEEEAKAVILRHGCTLKEGRNECIIYFPEGTTKTEILFRTMNARYQIKLPDGYELRETYDRHQAISLLSYSPE